MLNERKKSRKIDTQLKICCQGTFHKILDLGSDILDSIKSLLQSESRVLNDISLWLTVYTLISKTRSIHEKDIGAKWRKVIYFHDILQIGSCIIDAPFIFCSAFHVFRNDRGSEQGQMVPIWMVEVGKDHLMVIEPMAPRLIMNDKGHLLRLGIAHPKQEEREQVEEGPSLKVCIITAKGCTQGHFQVFLFQKRFAYFMNHFI